MDFKSHALKLNHFLTPYRNIWCNEVMNDFPHSLLIYPKEWLDLLSTLSEEEIYHLDSKREIYKLKNTSFHDFLENLKTLTTLPQIKTPNSKKLEPWAYIDIKAKKKHEIDTLCPVIENIFSDKKFSHLLDIGGGVGHLSRTLALYYGIKSTSLDMNQEFQEIGKKRLSRFRKPENSNELDFINLKFTNENIEKNVTLQKLMGQQTFTVGLHTCGNLAMNLIDTTLYFNGKGLLNFGCCYHKLKPDKELFNSTFYKENNLTPFHEYALTLATRAHGSISYEEFKTKKRVKYFRYGLHLFLIEHFNNNTYTNIGECPIHVYHGNFSTYVNLKLKELNLENNYTDDYIESFFNRRDINENLEKMFLCNIIRWQLGRALEIYLLLDRCLYLIEKNYQVEMNEYFEENVSPRNIGILAFQTS